MRKHDLKWWKCIRNISALLFKNLILKDFSFVIHEPPLFIIYWNIRQGSNIFNRFREGEFIRREVTSARGLEYIWPQLTFVRMKKSLITPFSVDDNVPWRRGPMTTSEKTLKATDSPKSCVLSVCVRGGEWVGCALLSIICCWSRCNSYYYLFTFPWFLYLAVWKQPTLWGFAYLRNAFSIETF